MIACPFCGAPETARLDLEGRRFLVFRCQFTPEVDPTLTDEEIAERLASAFAGDAPGYFRRTCDRLHVYVTRGDGARWLDPAGPPPRG
ncbi:MAG TPA: hypothetical protein VEL82_03440 [Thermoplasmata archaeon]|nr:hypothetical protein [Thermoplasmata archaeon]